MDNHRDREQDDLEDWEDWEKWARKGDPEDLDEADRHVDVDREWVRDGEPEMEEREREELKRECSSG